MRLVWKRIPLEPLRPGCIRTDSRQTVEGWLKPTDPEYSGEGVKVAELVPSHWSGPERTRWGVRGFGPIARGDTYLDYEDTLAEAKRLVEEKILRLFPPPNERLSR